MNYISKQEKVESINFVKERGLINDMWAWLTVMNPSGVLARNLLLFLLAVVGLDVDLPKVTTTNLRSEGKEEAQPL